MPTTTTRIRRPRTAKEPRPGQKLLTPGQLEKARDVPQRTIRQAIANRDLSAYRFGRSYRIDIADFDAWLARRRTTGVQRTAAEILDGLNQVLRNGPALAAHKLIEAINLRAKEAGL